MKGILKALVLASGVFVIINSCKPDIYKGPLDNPYGNWLGVHTDYFFNSETVAQTDACGYSVISFYRQGLCCIEGHKGALPFSYDHESSSLEVGQDRWTVTTLTGAEMVLEFIGTVIPEQEPDDNGGETGTEENEDGLDGNGIKLPAEFKGMTITSDGTAYFTLTRTANKSAATSSEQKTRTAQRKWISGSTPTPTASCLTTDRLSLP